MNILYRVFDRIRQKYDSVAAPEPNASSSVKLDSILNALIAQNERIERMAISLEGLSNEITRNTEVAKNATMLIDKLFLDVRNISDEMIAFRASAEANTVDGAMLDELITKLKQSTDALETAQKK